ncbi:MAG: sugar phosphate isomerase/epimerase family protein [Candidatus Bathyarchaeia archaeon]
MAEHKIGLSTLHCLDKPFMEMTKKIAEANVRYVEVVDDGFHTLDKRKVSILRDLGKSYSINYSVHAPFADINIASPSNFMLKAMLRRLKKSIVHASGLNACMWVFHPGLKTGISMFYPNMDWVQNCKTAKHLSQIASDYGVKIAIENVPEPYPFLMKSVEEFAKFYGEVDEDVGLALDVGHANLNGQIELFLKSFADKVVHMHVHDNDGTDDQHLGIGYGTINWEKFANLLKKTSFDGAVVIESVEHVAESVQKIKQLLG